MISEKNINNGILHFNHEHYMKVRKVHKLKNEFVVNAEWNHIYHEGNKVIDHPLLYKVIRDKETKTLHIVTKVFVQFYAGFQLVIQYDTTSGSSGIVNLDNGSSIALLHEPEFYKRFEVTDITINHFFEGIIDRKWFDYVVSLNEKVFKHFANCK